jgi:hypothetical protein
MAPYWVKALSPLPASDEGPTPFFPCNQRRATKKAHALQRSQGLAERNLSIRSAGLHRRYPLHPRSQSHFVGPQAPTDNHQDHCCQLVELHHQVMKLTTQVG